MTLQLYRNIRLLLISLSYGFLIANLDLLMGWEFYDISDRLAYQSLLSYTSFSAISNPGDILRIFLSEPFYFLFVNNLSSYTRLLEITAPDIFAIKLQLFISNSCFALVLLAARLRPWQIILLFLLNGINDLFFIKIRQSMAVVILLIGFPFRTKDCFRRNALLASLVHNSTILIFFLSYLVESILIFKRSFGKLYGEFLSVLFLVTSGALIGFAFNALIAFLDIRQSALLTDSRYLSSISGSGAWASISLLLLISLYLWSSIRSTKAELSFYAISIVLAASSIFSPLSGRVLQSTIPICLAYSFLHPKCLPSAIYLSMNAILTIYLMSHRFYLPMYGF